MMKKNIFIGFLFCLVISSCKYLAFDKECYLDFRLGMEKIDYKHIERQYLKNYILKEELSKSTYDYSASKTILTQVTTSNIYGALEPIFLSGRLDELRIFIGEDVSNNSSEATLELYDKIVNQFKIEEGEPKRHSVDEKTGHRLTEWETNHSYTITVVLVPAYSLSKKQVAIYYSPTGDLEKELNEYNEKKKTERN